MRKRLWSIRRCSRLTGIYFTDGVLRFVWHKGLEYAVRDKGKDYREEIEGDAYEFRAYRIRGDRSVARFDLRPLDGLAAVFLQIAVDEDDQKAVLEDIRDIVGRLWSFDEFQPLAIGTAIRKLDTRALQKDGVTAHSTRLNSGEAYVEFGIRSVQSSYQDSTPVRDVRLAVRAASFRGMNGTFALPTAGNGSAPRNIRVQMFGAQRKIRFASQMSANEVWSVLGVIAEST
jgi:hypothetical protein